MPAPGKRRCLSINQVDVIVTSKGETSECGDLTVSWPSSDVPMWFDEKLDRKLAAGR